METKHRLFEMCKSGEHPTCQGVFEVPGSRPRTPDNPHGILRHECSCDCHQDKLCTCDKCGARALAGAGTQCPSCGTGKMMTAAGSA